MKVQASLPVDQPRDLKRYRISGTATLPTLSLAGIDMQDVFVRPSRLDNGVLQMEELRGQFAGRHSPPAPSPGVPGWVLCRKAT